MAQIGKAAVYAVNGGIAFAALAKTAFKLVGASVADEFDVTELVDGTGEIIGAGSTKHRRKATFELIPYDSGGALATAKSNIKLPDPLALVVISDFGVDELDGNWNYIGGGQIALSADGYIKMTLPCAQYGSTPAAFNPVT